MKESGKCCVVFWRLWLPHCSTMRTSLSSCTVFKLSEWKEINWKLSSSLKSRGLFVLTRHSSWNDSFIVCNRDFAKRLTWDERAPRTSKVQPSAELITDMQTLTARRISWLHGFPLTSSCTAQDPASLAPHVWYCHLHLCKMDCSGPAAMLSELGPCNRAPNRITCTWLHSCMVFPIVFLWVEVQNSYQPTLPGSFPVRIKFSGTQESLRSAMKSVQVKAKKAAAPVTNSAKSCSMSSGLTFHPGQAEETTLDQGLVWHL